MSGQAKDHRPKRSHLLGALLLGVAVVATAVNGCRRRKRPRHRRVSWHTRRAVDGRPLLNPQLTLYKEYEEPKADLQKEIRHRIPRHLNAIHAKARADYGMDAVELSETLKSWLLDDREWFRQTFQTGGAKIKAIMVKSQAPAFDLDAYGLGVNLRVVLLGLWHNIPLRLLIPIEVTLDGSRLVRVNTDVNPDRVALDDVVDPERPELLAFVNRWNALGMKTMRDKVDRHIRALLRDRLALSAGSTMPSSYRAKYLIPLTVFDVTALADFDGDGKARDRLRLINRHQEVHQGDETWVKQFSGYDIWLGDKRIFSSIRDRVKLVGIADMDGDRRTDVILVVDEAQGRAFVGPRDYRTKERIVSRVFYMDGVDVAAGRYRLGPARFLRDEPYCHCEVRDMDFVPNRVGNRFRDWDVRFHLLDHAKRLRIDELVVDKFLSDVDRAYFRWDQKSLF